MSESPAPPPASEALALAQFLEPARADQGQRWVDVNLATAENIWSLFNNPSINGGCVFFFEPCFFCFFLNALLQVPWQKCSALSLCPSCNFCDILPGTGPFSICPPPLAVLVVLILTFESHTDFQQKRT